MDQYWSGNGSEKCRLQIRFCFGSVYSFMQFNAVDIFHRLMMSFEYYVTIQLRNTVEENKEEEKLRGL